MTWNPGPGKLKRTILLRVGYHSSPTLPFELYQPQRNNTQVGRPIGVCCSRRPVCNADTTYRAACPVHR